MLYARILNLRRAYASFSSCVPELDEKDRHESSALVMLTWLDSNTHYNVLPGQLTTYDYGDS